MRLAVPGQLCLLFGLPPDGHVVDLELLFQLALQERGDLIEPSAKKTIEFLHLVAVNSSVIPSRMPRAVACGSRVFHQASAGALVMIDLA